MTVILIAVVIQGNRHHSVAKAIVGENKEDAAQEIMPASYTL